MASRDWTVPFGVLAAEWAIACAFAGPVLATGGLAVCVAFGGTFARWVGRKMFGAGGTS